MGSTVQHLLTTVRSALHRLSPQTRHVLVAVSGGCDSMVLLELLQRIAATGPIRLSVAHIHHGIRGPEADWDLAFVRTVARRRGLPFVSIRVDTPAYRRRHGLGLEEAARLLRYRALERLRRQTSADVIATAHHANDQAETVFLRATRGSGLKGLAGILPKLEDPPVIRPLLEVTGRDIRAFATRHDLSFREDSSNLDLRMRRNLIRHHFLRMASRETGSDLSKSLVRLSTVAQRLRQAGSLFLDDLQRKSIVPEGDALLLRTDALEGLPRNVQNELVVRFLAQRSVAPTTRLLASIDRLRRSTTGRWIVAGGSQWRIYRERTGLALVRWRPQTLTTSTVRPGVALKAGQGRLSISARRHVPRSLRSKPHVAWVDAAAATRPLRVRLWRPADRMVPLGMTSHKKVSDLLTDGKVPSYRRRSIPVVTSGGRIVWLCGIRLDDRFKVTSQTRHVLQFSYHSNV